MVTDQYGSVRRHNFAHAMVLDFGFEVANDADVRHFAVVKRTFFIFMSWQPSCLANLRHHHTDGRGPN